MSEILDQTFAWVLNTSLRASLLTLAVLMLQGLLQNRISARWRYALWLPVLVVLLLPVEPRSSWSIGSLFLDQTQTHPTPAAAPSAPVVSVAHSSSPVSLTPAFSPGPPVAPPLLNGFSSAAWLWLTGTVALLGLQASFYERLGKYRRSQTAVSDLLQRKIAALTVEAGLRRPPVVCCSSAITSPAVTGLWRPILMLPADLEHRYSLSEIEWILRHELTHLRRRDLPMNALLCWLLALHWFNPLLWLAFRRARTDCESACDSQVLENSTPGKRREYGHLLLKTETHFMPMQLHLGWLGLFSRGSQMRARIQCIANLKPSHPAMKYILTTAIVGLSFFGITRAEEQVNVTGNSMFREGDRIVIKQVQRGDGFMTVTADYTLASAEKARLLLSVTANGDAGKT